jgi:predicted DNA-binding transcriptional regulator AlpA
VLYDFTFVVEGVDPSDDEVVAVLTEELDATLAKGAGVDLLLMTAEGASAVDAAQNAMRSVGYLAPQIRFLYLDRDLVGVSEIAERTGRSRQNVTQWVNAERRGTASTPFPKIEGVVGRARIWLWSEVNAWLRLAGLGDPIPSPRRHEITDIDFLIRHKDWLTRKYPTQDVVWPVVYLERSHEPALPTAGSSPSHPGNIGVTDVVIFVSTTYAGFVSTTYAGSNLNPQTGGRWVTSQVLGIRHES